MGIQQKDLDDKAVSKIRETLPFGPPWPLRVEELASELGVFPISIFRIWAGLTFQRRTAFPKDHPMRLNINAENARKQRERDKIRHIDLVSIGTDQDWKCLYCKTPLIGKQSPLTAGKRYHRDHIVPLTADGLTEQSNIQSLCPKCNYRKNNLSHEQFLKVLPRMERAETERLDWAEQQSCDCRYEGCYPNCSGCNLCREYNDGPTNGQQGQHPYSLICSVVKGIHSEHFDWVKCSEQAVCRASGLCHKLNLTTPAL